MDKQFKSHKLSVKIFNGAIAGIGAHQEALKLFRDIQKLKPDLVLSYSGVNDFDSWQDYSPFVKDYQFEFLNQLFKDPISPILPNTIRCLQSVLGKEKKISGVHWGKKNYVDKKNKWIQGTSVRNNFRQNDSAFFL